MSRRPEPPQLPRRRKNKLGDHLLGQTPPPASAPRAQETPESITAVSELVQKSFWSKHRKVFVSRKAEMGEKKSGRKGRERKIFLQPTTTQKNHFLKTSLWVQTTAGFRISIWLLLFVWGGADPFSSPQQTTGR